MRWSKVAILGAILAVGPWGPTPSACAGEPAIVVIDQGRAEAKPFCSTTTNGSSSGLDVLRGTGAQVVTRDFGAGLGEAVCSIDGVGNPRSKCLDGAGYWRYWQAVDGAWKESSLGSSSSKVKAGGVEAWVWETNDQPSPPRLDPRVARCVSREEPAVDGASKDGSNIYLLLVGAGLLLTAYVSSAVIKRRR